MKHDLKIILYHLVDNFLFGKNSHQPKFVSAGSENVFCVFLNKEIRYWYNSNIFRVLLMWSIIWLIISFLGKIPISQILGGGQLAHMHVSACWAVAHVSYMKVAYTGAWEVPPRNSLDAHQRPGQPQCFSGDSYQLIPPANGKSTS